MAKLNKQMQKQVDDAKSSFEPLPDGVYHALLRDVDTTREGPKGPYWSWEFEVIDDEFKGRRLWNNTSLSKEAAFKMNEAFTAFGVTSDTDTDDLIGQVVKLQVSTRTIQEGSRKGEPANQIDRVKPADDEVKEQVDAEAKSKKEMEEIF
jgi:hypothetical protein